MDKSVNEFIYYAKLYKERFGHIEIKENDCIDSFDIGCRLCFIRGIYKNNRLSEENIRKIKELDICLESKSEKDYIYKMELAKQAINEGIIIKSTNISYKGQNLYYWVHHSVKRKYQNKCLTKEETKLIEELIGKKLEDFYSDRSVKFKKKFDLCIQAVKEGVVLSESNKMYKKVNLFSWIKNHKKQFLDNELETINRLMPPCHQSVSVKLMDMFSHECKEYISISEAGRALHNEFNITDNDNKGIKAVHNRLTGKVTTPYKGRFMFYYADEKTTN